MKEERQPQRLAPCTMAMFLTDDEIRTLTGYKRPADQQRWLLERAWLYETNAAGRPIILRSYANSRLSGIKGRGQSAPTLSPNFSMVNG